MICPICAQTFDIKTGDAFHLINPLSLSPDFPGFDCLRTATSRQLGTDGKLAQLRTDVDSKQSKS